MAGETSLTCGEPPAKIRENHREGSAKRVGGDGSITRHSSQSSQVKFYTGCNPRNGTIENAVRRPFIDVSCAKASPRVSLSLSINELLCGTLSCAPRFSFSPLLSSQTQASQRSIDRPQPYGAGNSRLGVRKETLVAPRVARTCFVFPQPATGLLYVFGINWRGRKKSLDLSPRRIEFSTVSPRFWRGLFHLEIFRCERLSRNRRCVCSSQNNKHGHVTKYTVKVLLRAYYRSSKNDICFCHFFPFLRANAAIPRCLTFLVIGQVP